MTIGIIGAGGIGQAFARHLVRAGYDVVISNSRGPDSLSSLVRDLGLGARAGPVREASGVDPHEAGGRRVIVMSGDDAEAKTAGGCLLDRVGFPAIDLGGLATGGRLQQFPGGPFPTLNLIQL